MFQIAANEKFTEKIRLRFIHRNYSTTYVDEVCKEIKDQIDELESYLNHPDAAQIQVLNSIEKSFIIPNKRELLVSVESSNSFNSIYNASIFSVLNNTISDTELFNSMEESLEYSQHELLATFIYPNRNLNGMISNEKSLFENLFLNELNRFVERIRMKYASLVSLNRNYKLLLKQINLKLENG
ncbi:MAG: hypothetical protein HYZ43_00600 [Flavobacteriia bacterium]|nr:hypothetical protein [Flavobacteriia bacterium]